MRGPPGTASVASERAQTVDDSCGVARSRCDVDVPCHLLASNTSGF